MLKSCSLLFELVVVVLQNLNQPRVVLNLLFILKFELGKVDAIVVRHSCKFPKMAVFCGNIFELVLDLVHKLEMLSDPPFFGITFLP
jgi:hypothetical protein